MERLRDRKSTRLNSSHVESSYAVFCLKKKNDPRLVRRTTMVVAWVNTTRRWPSFAWLTECWSALADRSGWTSERNALTDVVQRASTVRYYLGRGRRAREAGRFEAACSYARRA